MERLTNILIVLIAIFAFWTVLRIVLFRRGSRGNVPTADQVLSHVTSMGQESKETVGKLWVNYNTELSEEAFSILCIATAMSTEQPLSGFEKKVVLARYLDSLNFVEYIILLEELFDISVPDEKSDNFITFRKVVDYVNSTVAK